MTHPNANVTGHPSPTHESVGDKDAAAAFLADLSDQDQAHEEIDPEAERRLLWKIDLL
jgi:hypothetical protein